MSLNTLNLFLQLRAVILGWKRSVLNVVKIFFLLFFVILCFFSHLFVMVVLGEFFEKWALCYKSWRTSALETTKAVRNICCGILSCLRFWIVLANVVAPWRLITVSPRMSCGTFSGIWGECNNCLTSVTAESLFQRLENVCLTDDVVLLASSHSDLQHSLQM